MLRLLYVLCFSSLVSLSLAAPVPKGKDEAFKKAPWGKPIDPDKVCKFTFTKDAVTIEVPAGRRIALRGEKSTAPRLLRPAEGDFEVQVRVRADFRPSPLPRLGAEVTAALLVLDKDAPTRAFRAEFGARHNGRDREPTAHVSRMGPKRSGQAIQRPLHTVVKDAAGGEQWQSYLKLERRGGVLRAFISADGKEWRVRPPLNPKSLSPDDPEDRIQGEVKVGVAVFSRSADKFKVTFDRFKLTPLKPRKD
jgi:hypothetical protein